MLWAVRGPQSGSRMSVFDVVTETLAPFFPFHFSLFINPCPCGLRAPDVQGTELQLLAGFLVGYCAVCTRGAAARRGVNGRTSYVRCLLSSSLFFSLLGKPKWPCFSVSASFCLTLEQFQQFGKPTWHPYNLGKT
jgi:hypothetical protein